MQLKIKNLKPIKITSLLLICLLAGTLSAQEIIEDSPEVAKNSIKNDTVKPFQRFKAEGISAVVGEYVILDSDIDKSYLEYKQQDISTDDITRCQLLGKLMEDKLYAHQAKQDSLDVPDSQINGKIEQQLQYMISELGSEEKVAAYYRKDNLADLRKELYDVNKTLALAGEMQRKIIENVEITPEEVRSFFYEIPEDKRPIISAEVEVAQIVVEPEITEKAHQDVIDKLNEMRIDILENGSSFATKAVLYSKDEGSARLGGLINGIKRDSPFDKEFKDRAFSLLEGEISEPFESTFGFHIVYVEKIRGQEIDVRHILLFPEVSQETIDKAKAEIESLREKIISGDLSFADAAREASDEKETRNNGGQLVNPITGDTRFDLTKMEPTLNAQVYNLKVGEVSKIYTDRESNGRNKFKILTVTNKYDEHPADYAKDYEKIKELALRKKQIEAIEKWQNNTIKDTYVNVNEDYQGCEFSSNWIKK